LPRLDAPACRGFFAALLEPAEIPAGVLEAAVRTGTGLLSGASDILDRLDSLVRIEAGGEAMQLGVEELLRGMGRLIGHRSAAYVLEQVVELVAAAAGAPAPGNDWPRIPRLKGLMEPIEDALSRAGVAERMDAVRLGTLLVRLDELYDDASVQVERALHLAARPLPTARQLAPEFLRRLHREFAKASLADHLLAEHEKGAEGAGTGLITLLPELTSVLRELGPG
jgi:hypothetical protein